MSTAVTRASAGASFPGAAVYNSFVGRLCQARKRVLLLDYDGTIAPFCASRNRALPYPLVPELLKRIMNTGRTRVVLISGRAAKEVPELLGLPCHPEIWGTHGLECLYPDGHYEVASISHQALHVLDRARALLQNLGLLHVAEVKHGAIAVHWRGLGAMEREHVRAKTYEAWSPLVRDADLLLNEFDGGIELRVRMPNKGDVVLAIAAELDSDVPIAYLGDDATDEDAFRALSGRGLTALVRSTYRFTAAQVWIQPPDGLVQFLTEWLQASGGEI